MGVSFDDCFNPVYISEHNVCAMYDPSGASGGKAQCRACALVDCDGKSESKRAKLKSKEVWFGTGHERDMFSLSADWAALSPPSSVSDILSFVSAWPDATAVVTRLEGGARRPPRARIV